MAPHSKLSAFGFNQVNIMTYGGGLWRTWFDRDLTLAGKVVIKSEDGSKLESKLWACQHALMKVPNLAIHLDRQEEFCPNKETHLKPILAMGIIDQIFGESVTKLEDDKFKLDEKHFSTLTNLIATDLNIDRSRIIDFELNICDTQPPALFGIHQEFVSSPRLDNLGSSLVALDSLIDHSKVDMKVRDNAEIEMILLFDHEEIGSQSAQGADSNMAAEITQRIFENYGGPSEDYYRAIHRSYLLSADMAHAVHPNYSAKHHSQHMPTIHGGIVIKINANQRYATDVVSSSALKVIAAKADVPLQEFIVRNDSLCGSTIGPIIASKAGLKTIDIGAPMLAMHSIRESCGVVDLLYYRRLFNVFFHEGATVISDLLNE